MHKTAFLTFLDPDVATRITAAAPADFEISVHPADLPDAEKTPLVATADFLILFPGHLSPNVLRAATRLKLIQLLSAGYEHMDLDLCTQLGIPVANNGGANAVDVAEHTLGLILALYRRLAEQDRAVRRDDWNLLDSGRTTYTIYGRTAALIGLGHIGRHIAARLAAFGADLLYVDAQPAPEDFGVALERVDLDEALARADIVSLHVPLTDQTRGLIGARRLALMRPSALLINTCRGPVIAQEALVAALREQRILGADLDVFACEPLAPDHPLLDLPNALLTPHAAGITRDTWSRRAGFAFANFQRVLAGEEPLARIG